MSCCCGGWFKRKPGDSHGSQERPSTDPPGSVENAENTSTDPLVQTAQNPSDGSKDHLLVETAKRPSLSTTPIGPSSSKKPPTTLEEVVGSLKEVDIARLGDFIDAIKQLLERLAAQKDTQDTASLSFSNEDSLSRWASIIQTGKTFLSFVSDQAEKVDTKNEFFKSGEATKIAGDVLQHIGQIHWMVGVLSITGYLISKCQKVSENRTGYIELLQNILELASYIKNLNILIPENEKNEKKEKLVNAFQYIIEGSMFCAAQLNSGKFCSFFKSSINSDTLCAIRSKISDLYKDLNSIVNIEMLQGQPVSLPLSLPEYPKEAVGIEDQLKEVNNLLNMETTEDCSSLIVLIWGFGGIGKTTLAQAVVSKIDRSRYNYARIILDEISENNKNKYTDMQKNILKDAFPNYMGGREINLRDNEDGKDKLREACTGKGNKAVFLYIDNALHKNDLEELLPKDLGCLPQQSRILITTRTMDVADMLQKRGFSDHIKDYPVKTLSDNDAMEILCKDCSIRDHIKEDLQKIVNVCKGIPLVLEIVGADLKEENYDANRCTQTIEDLNEGKDINDLSDRMFHFIYKKLDEATKDAFLDICCCFNNSERRQFVEDIVGTREVRRLLKAALITPVKVKINFWSGEEEERLTVHDIIGSIGRRLGKPSRITDRNTWAVAEKNEARLKKIKAVILPHGTEGYTLEEEHLNSMKERLRILVWDGCINVSVTEVVKLPELRQVTISGDISWLNVEALNKLVILECHRLPTPQIGLLTLPKCLRRISISKLVQPADTQNFLKMVPNSSLEELHLIFEDTQSSTESSSEEEVKSVDAFPEAIAPNEDEYNIINAFNRFLYGLNNLKVLEIKNCSSLCELPEQVCRLPQLIKLSIESCKRIKRLPESFGQLEALQYLNLSRCESLEKLPFTIGQLTSLTHLDLLFSPKLKELPETFGQLVALQRLDLSFCDIEKLPSTIGQLKNLVDLRLKLCENLKELPETFCQLEALQYLDLCDCSNLQELPSTIEQFINLTDLDLSMCDSLKELPDTLGRLEALQRLYLINCRGIEKLPSTIGQLVNLTELNLWGCKRLKELPDTFGQLEALQVLDLRDCPQFEELPHGIQQLRSLRNLKSDICQEVASEQ